MTVDFDGSELRLEFRGRRREAAYIDSAMQMGIARALLTTVGVGWLAACGQTLPATTPEQAVAESDSGAEREQEALDRRRIQLERQVLSELRKLRANRQASTGDAEASDDEAASAPECDLLVFGGATHDVFLGCLADERRPDSVFNLVGEHGSDLSPVSIRNKFAPYGSNYDDTSACNAAATHPPVVVTSSGKSLGLLTMNPSLKRRITAPSVADWLARMCGV